jgi:drug/metabolite transporter (DMT)-like permease
MNKNLTSTRRTAQLALLSITAIWGWSFVIIKESLINVGTYTFLFYRFSLATIILIALFWPHLRKADPKTWRNGILIGIALFIGYSLQTYGLNFTTASNSAFITGLSVVIVPILGMILLGQRIGRAAWLGVGTSALGLALIVFGRSTESFSINLGHLLTITATVGFAFQILWISHVTRPENYKVILVAQIAVVALFSGLGMLLTEGPVLPYTLSVWEGILFTSILATVVALGIQVRFQTQATAVQTAIIFAFEPVFGGIFGYLFRGEQFANWQWLGAIFIIAAMIISQLPARVKEVT